MIEQGRALRQTAAQVLRAMAYEHRVHLLTLLYEQEQTAGSLAETVHLEASLVAHHLRYLREANLIDRSRRGRHVYYRLAGDPARRLVDEVLRYCRARGGPRLPV